jgi:hypothetical protein
MNLTMGPLPASVYWRRRALLAAAVLVVIVLAMTMCGGPGSSGATNAAAGTAAIASPTTSTAPTPGHTTQGLAPIIGGSAGPTGSTSAAPPPVATPPAARPSQPPAPVPTGPCQDGELSVTSGISPTPGVYGGTFTLTLAVRNISARSCARDVGAGPQELRVLQAGKLVWSSDDCGGPQSSDVRTFAPNIEARFYVSWNSYRVLPHDCQLTGPPAAPGAYQVVARLGSLLGAPVGFQINR